jgi:hypothetical protein
MIVDGVSLMMEAAAASETSINFYHAEWRNIPKTVIFVSCPNTTAGMMMTKSSRI